MLSNVIEFHRGVSEKLDGTITITKRVVVYSLSFILLLFGALSVFSPLSVRKVLRLHTNVVWLPDDPENKMKWAVHSEAQDAALFRMKCQELQEQGGVTFPPEGAPRPKRTKRSRR